MTPQKLPKTASCGRELADRLEHLLRLPLSTPADIEPWLNACDEVRAWIDAAAAELPAQLMFYFRDPDIRVDDPSYKEHQERDIRRLICKLRGQEPPDDRRH